LTRILLVRLRQIGDVVFTTPAIRALRERFHDAHISYVVEPAAAPVVVGNPHLDNVIVAPRAAGVRGFVQDLKLGARLRAERYDLAIDFHGGPRASLLTWLSRASERIGYDGVGRAWMYTRRVARTRALRARHSVENQWDLLAALGIAPPERALVPVEMPADAATAASVRERLERAGVEATHHIVVIHVSAGNPFRRWPTGHFVTLATTLASSDPRRRIVITSGPSEQNASQDVIDRSRDRGAKNVVSCGEFSLPELRALLDRAALFIGGDSGPLHVAATTEVPIVGLYGPTLPERSAPWRDPRIPTESVDAGLLPCRPCDQRVCAPGDFRCLAWVTPERVIEAAERVIKSRRDSATAPTPSR
jgi:lipopolysaccharide heptosyltransferase II